MKRPIKLLMFLLAGAMMNVSVAWALALYGPENRYDEAVGEFVETTKPTWMKRVVDAFGSRFVYAEVGYTSPVKSVEVPNWSYAINAPTAQDAEGFLSVTEQARGWPALSLYGRITQSGVDDEKFDGIWVCGPAVRKNRLHAGELPRKVIWPGFAINTIFYAAIVWALFAVPGAVRRRLRHKRGQCASCGYSLRESVSEKCPECGKARHK